MRSGRRAGFTLLEMLVALAIVLLAAGALTRTLITGMTLASRAAKQAEAVDAARNGLATAEGSGGATVSITTRLENGLERVVTVQPRPDLVNPAVAGQPIPDQIDVVVHWREGGRNRDFSLSTLRLDAKL